MSRAERSASVALPAYARSNTTAADFLQVGPMADGMEHDPLAAYLQTDDMTLLPVSPRIAAAMAGERRMPCDIEAFCAWRRRASF